MKKRGPCKHANIQPDKAGRVTMRANAVWPCSCPLPELPALPASITSAYGYTWPPGRSYVDRERCEACPCWSERAPTNTGEKP